MKIIEFSDKYKKQVISLVLYIQNIESKVELTLFEQPDLKDINRYYLKNGGGFWLAVDEQDNVIGCIGLMIKNNKCGILKKFFIKSEYRGNGISKALYANLTSCAQKLNLKTIILDTPAICTRAHNFYLKMGYRQISRENLPIEYDYPDRNSILFIKNL